MNKNALFYLHHSIPFVASFNRKRLVFREECYIDMEALFETNFENARTGLIEKPFRDLIPQVGSVFDPSRKLKETFRYQMSFFLLTVLYHQLGDNLTILQGNRDVLLTAGFQVYSRDKQGNKKFSRIFTASVYVNSILFLFETFERRYGLATRTLGKIICSFYTHALLHMDENCKKPTQSSQKIKQEIYILLKKAKTNVNVFPFNLIFLDWSLNELHLMMPILQECDFISKNYPVLREIRSFDYRQMKLKQMKGGNVQATQKTGIDLRRQLELQELLIKKMGVELGKKKKDEL